MFLSISAKCQRTKKESLMLFSLVSEWTRPLLPHDVQGPCDLSLLTLQYNFCLLIQTYAVVRWYSMSHFQLDSFEPAALPLPVMGGPLWWVVPIMYLILVCSFLETQAQDQTSCESRPGFLCPHTFLKIWTGSPKSFWGSENSDGNLTVSSCWLPKPI